MTISSQQYATLADHSYGRDEHGNAVDLRALVGKPAVIGGIKYEVLAYADKPSGYQGAIYQRVDTGEIVVAHRGTEFDRQKWADLVKADGMMAMSRFNLQADDAIALTQQARELADDYAERRNIAAPSVTHTGHSLGGTLAQISGHYFGQTGETFNAYGAASLTVHNPATGELYRMPPGGNAFRNHVMGADLVSSASPQYGEEIRYTNQREIDTLERWGYENNRGFDLRFEGAAVEAISGGSHDMHNFLPWNGDHRRDVSILADADARRMANDYDPMLDKYRGDVRTLREGVGLLGTNPADIGQLFKGPLEAGEPARRADQQRNRRGASLDPAASESTPDMRMPGHPANEKYQQAYAGIVDVDRSLGRTPDAASERLAASLTAAGAGLKDISQVALSSDGSRAFATESGLAEARQRVAVSVASAVQRPVEASTQDWQQATGQLALEQAQQQSLERENPTLRGPALA